MEIAIPSFNGVDFLRIGPILILSFFGMLVLLWDSVIRPHGPKEHLAYLSLAGVILALMLCLRLLGEDIYGSSFGDMLVLDHYALFFYIIFLLGTGLTLLLSVDYLRREGVAYGEYYALLLFTAVGMMLMASGLDLILIFLGLEILSMSLYILSGYIRTDRRGVESALKYFLLGAFATGFFLYGISWIYGATGSTNLREIANYLAAHPSANQPMLLVGMSLLIIGFAFKVACVPFHMWTPDVYEGAPTTITAFMSVGSKAAGFSSFFRVFLYALPSLQADWRVILVLLAILTMTVGNVVAIAQTNIKRMLAYSSIGHAGYLLVALVAGNDLAISSTLFYLVAYTLMNLGAFAVVIALERKREEYLQISDYCGLGFRYPLLAAVMSLFLFSLAGIPPTAGFVGKFYIFGAAVKAGYVGLAVIGVLNSLISIYFYLRVIVYMYMREPTVSLPTLSLSGSFKTALGISALGTILFGLFPSPLLSLAQQAVSALLG